MVAHQVHENDCNGTGAPGDTVHQSSTAFRFDVGEKFGRLSIIGQEVRRRSICRRATRGATFRLSTDKRVKKTQTRGLVNELTGDVNFHVYKFLGMVVRELVADVQDVGDPHVL